MHSLKNHYKTSAHVTLSQVRKQHVGLPETSCDPHLTPQPPPKAPTPRFRLQTSPCSSVHPGHVLCSQIHAAASVLSMGRLFPCH